MTTIEKLREKKSQIFEVAARHGVVGIYVFGSVARGDDRPDSDVDLLIAPGPSTSPWFPAGLVLDIESLLGRRVEVVTDRGLNPHLRDDVLKEAVSL